MSEQTYINLPPWDGQPREMELLWEAMAWAWWAVTGTGFHGITSYDAP